MKKLFLCLTILICLYGCKNPKKYTDAELNIAIQKVIDAYEKDILPRKTQQAKDEGYTIGRNTGKWENKIKLLEELEQKLPKNIIEILNKYRKEK